MAYDFAPTSYVALSSAVITATPCTFACWFNIDNLGTQRTIMGVSQGAVGGEFYELFWASSNQLGADYWSAAGGNRRNIHTAALSAGTLYHGGIVYAATNSRTIYVNGVGETFTDAGADPAGVNATRIGTLRRNGAEQFPFDGKICEAAFWSAALTDGEVAALAKGFSPRHVRPQSLASYLPLVRDLQCAKGLAYSATGTAVADHPRIIY